MSDTVSHASAPHTPLDSTDSRNWERVLWWLALAGAAASVVVGLLMTFWPDATLYLGAVLFGLWLIVHGIIHLARAITSHADAAIRALDGVLGVLFVVAGIVCLRHIVTSLLVLATVIGLTWLIEGVIVVASTFGSRYTGRTRVVVGVLGGVAILGGLVVLLWPELTLVAMVVFTGIWLIVVGLVQLFLVLQLRRETAS
ncbi:HdeD family acid-resistance protein [Cryptosporangium aurantiacum]|uniref:Uncharacterized membrane protein HdeD, DUF308 family n=1 Tax=Cryptosporangium aurantiacum TaxID=134849 RepID=A0A1M7RK18_9ACTN|nr:DUF308 domain-containing protein [Cryptosporangium aurantiacum]SHN46509.1 Uncharacterized membrane protein HdeD, DUF308 family [Cryptosporangium aurantiacum]